MFVVFGVGPVVRTEQNAYCRMHSIRTRLYGRCQTLILRAPLDITERMRDEEREVW